MAKAQFTGKPVATPKSKRYRGDHPLPEWVLVELEKPAPGTARRIRDPKHGRDGLTLIEAAEGLGYSSPFSMYQLLDKPLPELGGKVMRPWNEYILEPSGRLLRLLVCSGDQVGLIKAARSKCDKELQSASGLTDEQVMRRHPTVFARRAIEKLEKENKSAAAEKSTAQIIQQVKKMTGRELRPFRPTCLTSWRDQNKKLCPYISKGYIGSSIEGGRIINNTEDIDVVAKNFLAVQDGEWTHPETKVVYVSTEAVQKLYGITEPQLTRCAVRDQREAGVDHPRTRYRSPRRRGRPGRTDRPHDSRRPPVRSNFLPGDGHFHPVPGPGQEGKPRKRWGRRWWPKAEVEAYAAAQKEHYGKNELATNAILRLVARKAIPASEAAKALEAEFPTSAWRQAAQTLQKAGKLVVTRTGSNSFFWHLPAVEKPVEKTRPELAKEYLEKLLEEGPLLQAEILAGASEAGFGSWLIYEARQAAGVLSRRFGPMGTPEQYAVWYLEGQDPQSAAPITGPTRGSSTRAANEETAEPDRPVQAVRRKHPGRPVGSIDEDVANRKREMLEAWDRDEFQGNKAEAGRSHGFHRSDATKIINEHERAKECRK
jgi:hypothetical protein